MVTPVKSEKPKKVWTATPLEVAIGTQFERMFQTWHDNQPPRSGIRVSALIRKPEDFCLRQMILMQHFPHAKLKIHPPTIRIFLHGWVIHEKWQKLFEEAGIATETETTHNHDSGATFTPDAVIEVFGKLYIVEIKSMNTAAYDSTLTIHADAEIQANMYMHLTGIHRAIVLMEDKNNQRYKLRVIQYDIEKVKPYLRRLGRVNAALEEFKLTKKLPSRHIKCPHPAATKAKNCPVKEACFAGKYERKEMLRAYRKQKKEAAARAA